MNEEKQTEYEKGFDHGLRVRGNQGLVGFMTGVLISILVTWAFSAEASTIPVTATVLCSNSNYQHSERCSAPPVMETMIINPYGVSSGELTSGVKWTQTRITESMSLFRMENVCWLTYKDVTVYCEI
jgi:hypothetical protein